MKRLISTTVIAALCLQLIGCTSSRNITREEFALIKKGNMQIVTKENKSYELVEDQYSVKNDTIFLTNGPIYFYPYRERFIDLDKVTEFEVSEADLTKSIMLGILTGGIIVGLYILNEVGTASMVMKNAN